MKKIVWASIAMAALLACYNTVSKPGNLGNTIATTSVITATAILTSQLINYIESKIKG